MKKSIRQLILGCFGLLALCQPVKAEITSVPDSVYLFTYATALVTWAGSRLTMV